MAEGLTPEQIKKLGDAIRDGRGVEVLQTFSPTVAGGDKDAQALESLKREFGTEGVEIDPSGVGFVPQAIAGLAQNEQDKEAVYKKYFGKDKVKKLSDNRYLIRVIRDGKPVDIIDNEPGLDSKDLLSVSGYVPEMATELFAASKLFPKISPQGLIGYAGLGLGSLAMGKMAGGAKDAALKWATDQPVDLKEIASKRLDEAKIEGPLGVFLPYAMDKSIGKLRPSAVSKGSTPADVNIAKRGVEASKRIEEGLGIKAPLSAGEATGSRRLQEYEGYGERVGRLLDPTGELRAAQEAALKEGQASLTSRTFDDATPIGSKVSKELGTQEADLVRKSQDVSERAIKTAEQRAFEATNFDVSDSVLGSGQQVRKGLQNVIERDSAEADRLYGEARKLLEESGGNENFVTPTATSKLGKRLSTKETLVKETTKTKEPPFIGADPIEEVTTEPIGWAIEAYDKAKSFADMGGTPQSFEAMRRARSLFGEVIGQAERKGVNNFGGGFQLKDAKQFYKSLSTDIDESLKQLSPEVAKAFKAANKQASDNFTNYTENPLFNRIRKEFEEGGFEEGSEIISHFNANKGNLEQLKKLGTLLDPSDYAALKRGVVADLTQDSMVRMPSGADFLDFSTLKKKLVGLNPEYKFEIFGGSKQLSMINEAS